MTSPRRLLLACVALGACVATSLPVAHATGVLAATPDVAQLEIVSQPFNILTSVNARFVLNTTLSVASDRRNFLEVSLHRRVASRDSFQSIANGDVEPGVIDRLTFTLGQVSRDPLGHLAPVVPIDILKKSPRSLLMQFDGIYPITLRILDSQTKTVLASVLTFLNRRNATIPSPVIPVATFVRLSAPPSLLSDGTVSLTDTTRQAISEFTLFLSSTTSPLTICAQPELIAALAQSTVPSDVEMFLSLRDQLRTRSVIASTFAPTDPSSLAAAGLSAEFIKQLRFGERTLNSFLPGVTIEATTWVGDKYLDSAGVSLLRRAGITTIILLGGGQQDVTAEKGPFYVSRPEGSENVGIAVISADQQASIDLDSTSISGPTLAYRVAAGILVQRDDLVAAGVSPGATRLLLSNWAGTLPNGSVLDIATQALATAPGIDMTDASTHPQVDATFPAMRFGKKSPATLAVQPSTVNAARTELVGFGSMLDKASPLLDTWEALLGLGISTTATTPKVYLNTLRAQLRETRRSITITTPEKITLSSKNGTIRLQLRNDSTQPLTIFLRLSSPKLTLAKPFRQVVLNGKSTTDIAIPAKARTNGSFSIVVRTTTPTGNLEVAPLLSITTSVNVITGLGQLVSITLLLVLIAWWWSNRRSVRRQAAGPTTVAH